FVSSGERIEGIDPVVAVPAIQAGSCDTALTAATSLSRTSAGRVSGANNALQPPPASISAYPSPRAVGPSGSEASRSGVVVTRMRSCPAFARERKEPRLPHANWVNPARSDDEASPVPLYGICVGV